jgi:hypothetical protein
MNAERERLRQSRLDLVPWKKWGPYLGERQRGHGMRALQHHRLYMGILYARPSKVARVSLARERNRRYK